MTFEELHAWARAQAIDAEPPDVKTGADAQLIVAVLLDWIAVNVDEARRQQIAAEIADALKIWQVDEEPSHAQGAN